MIWKTKVRAGETIKLPFAMKIENVYTVLDETQLPLELENLQSGTHGIYREPAKDWQQVSDNTLAYYSLIPYRREDVMILVKYTTEPIESLAETLVVC